MGGDDRLGLPGPSLSTAAGFGRGTEDAARLGSRAGGLGRPVGELSSLPSLNVLVRWCQWPTQNRSKSPRQIGVNRSNELGRPAGVTRRGAFTVLAHWHHKLRRVEPKPGPAGSSLSLAGGVAGTSIDELTDGIFSDSDSREGDKL